MNFKEWFYSASHRAKYTTDHPAYLAAQEAWEAAHEACAKVCDEPGTVEQWDGLSEAADRIRARGQV